MLNDKAASLSGEAACFRKIAKNVNQADSAPGSTMKLTLTGIAKAHRLSRAA
jgi:hypothetical protein